MITGLSCLGDQDCNVAADTMSPILHLEAVLCRPAKTTRIPQTDFRAVNDRPLAPPAPKYTAVILIVLTFLFCRWIAKHRCHVPSSFRRRFSLLPRESGRNNWILATATSSP